MAGPANLTPAPKRRRLWLPMMAFIALAIFMYASIMYKIIHYGA